MSISSIIVSIKNLGRRFVRGEILDWFYIAAILLFIGIIIIASISTLLSLLRIFDAVIFVSDAKETPQVSSFNMTGLNILAPRFGIAIPNKTLPSLQPSLEKEIPVITPSPLVSPISFSDLNLRILNSTTIPGLAKTWKKRFETKGVRNIYIGNAPQRDLRGIVVLYKPGKEFFLETVRGIFGQYGDIITHEQADASLESDVAIIIGK